MNLSLLPFAFGSGDTGAAVLWGCVDTSATRSSSWPPFPAASPGALGGAGNERVKLLSGNHGQPLLFRTEGAPLCQPERMCDVWDWRLRPELPDVPPSHPLCTAFCSSITCIFAETSSLQMALSHHITSGLCHRRGPFPLAPSVPLPPGPSCSFQLPLTLVLPSAFVSLCRFSSVLLCPCPLSLCACTSPLLFVRRASLSLLLSFCLGFFSGGISHALPTPPLLLLTPAGVWRPEGERLAYPPV